MLLKCDWMMPTGSFKDRGTSVMLSLLAQQGVGAVLEDSSGNGGASVAAYAAAGGLKATIMAPDSTSPAKTLAMRAHGATVELIPGNRQATSDAAVARSASVFYASHAWHPFFLHGTKTLAYELWEELGFRAPDNVIVPCGGGSNVLGCQIGFAELLRAGQIDATPRLFAAQPANCAPIATAFLAGADGPVATPVLPTIAEGTAIAAPVRLREVLGALRVTRGGAVHLEEAEIAAATLELAAAGLYVEPTSAQALAAHRRLLASGAIAPGQTTVLVLTGSGLKAGAAHRGTAGSVAMTRRIALLGFSIECNRFAPPATERDFTTRTLLRGSAMLADARSAAPRMLAELPGFIADMDAAGPWEPAPILLAMAEPNGPVEQGFFDRLMLEWEARLRAAGPLDGVYCIMHGAGLATADDDPEGTLQSMVRRVVGPEVPVVASYDLHANLSDAAIATLDAAVAYRTNPHLDMRERGAESAEILRRLLDGAPTAVALVRLPIVAPTVTMLTAPDAPNRPYGELIDLGQALMRAPPWAGRVLNVSVLGGFPYADTAHNGLAVVVTGTDRETAHGLALEIATRRLAAARPVPPASHCAGRGGAAGQGHRGPIAPGADLRRCRRQPGRRRPWRHHVHSLRLPCRQACGTRWSA